MRLLFLVALAACGSQQTPAQTQTPAPTQTPTVTIVPAPSQTQAQTAAPAACKTNDDCAIANVRECCAACGLPPFAELESAVDALTKKCASVECATRREAQECKPTESTDVYHAECRDAACVAVRNPPPQTPVAPPSLTSADACARDADCAVSNFSGCCAACQRAPYATSKRELDRREKICAVVDCAVGGDQRCPPVAEAALYRAVCRAGTCGGVKR